MGHGPRQFTAKDAPGGDRGNPREEGGPRGCGASGVRERPAGDKEKVRHRHAVTGRGGRSAPVAHKARGHGGGRADSGDVCSGVDDFRQEQGSKYFRLCGEY